jgi:hypothetical protein
LDPRAARGRCLAALSGRAQISSSEVMKGISIRGRYSRIGRRELHGVGNDMWAYRKLHRKPSRKLNSLSRFPVPLIRDTQERERIQR